MLDADYINRISEGAEEVAGDLHDEIIKAIVRRITARLGQGEDFTLTPTDKYQIEVLQEAGYLLEDIQKEIAKKTKTQRVVVARAFESAGVESVRLDAEVYRKAGISVEALAQSPLVIRVLQRNYEATMGLWDNYTRTTADTALKLFVSECNKAYNTVITGAITPTQAYYSAVERIAEQGVYVTYPKKDAEGNAIPGTVGQIDTIETATARAIRTGIAQGAGQATATRALENGVTCFLVSKHMGARPTHEKWQGKPYWVDWEELARRIPLPAMDEYPQATEEEKANLQEFCKTTDIGTVTGLTGANCRHNYGPFFYGLSVNVYDDINWPNDKGLYEKEQRQRTLERRIRHTKRAIMGYTQALEDVTDEEARQALNKTISKKAQLLYKQNKAYQEYCQQNNLKPQEQRLKVAGWTAEEARKAGL